MPNGTITSTENTFGTVNGALSGTVAGTLTGSVGVPGPVGPAGPGSTWGGIAGTLSAQTDLWTELGTKYLASNPAGYQTAGQVSTALAPYITSATATASFYPLSGNPSAFLQAAALSPYLTSATAASTYQTLSGMSSYLTTSAAAAGYYPLSGNPSGFLTAASLSGYATETWVTGQGYITASALSPYLTSATAASTYQTLSGMSSYLTTSTAASTYATIAQGQPASGTIGQVLTKNSGTNYDSSWQTLIPGDRYLTSSTTSLTINNDNKTLTVGTGLSYTSQQDVVIAYDASNHMHAQVLTYNSGTGVMTVDVQTHTGSGTYTAWTVNVGGTVPQTSVTWGSITGTLGDQTDLANALNSKLELSGGVLDANATIQSSTATEVSVFSGSGLNVELSANPSENSVLGYGGLQVQNFSGTMAVTPSGLTFPNASTQTVAYPGSSGFLLKADNLAGLANTATAQTNLGLGTMATATAADYSTTTVADGLYYPLSSNPASYLVAADIAGKAPLASPALTGNVTITSNSATAALTITQDGAGDILRLNDVAGDTTFTFVDALGKVNTIASTTASAGLNVPHATNTPTSPVNGDIWTTTGGLFARINGSSNQMMDLTTTQSVAASKTFTNANLVIGSSTAAGTIAIGSGATVSAATRTINIGTASAAGSTNAINIGGGSGTTNVTLGGSINLNGPIAAAINNISLGTGTAVSVYAFGTGATVSGSTKTVTIGTGALAGATTTIAIGSTTGTSTTTLQGTTNGVTAAADTNSVALATTAFVVGQAGSATPLVNGTAAVGTSLRYARQDHVHGTDTTRAPLASPAFTGTPSLPTGTTAITQTAGNNTTAVATTAFVTAAVPAAATHTQALQFSSTSAFTRVIDASSQLIAPSVLRVWPSPSNYNGTATSGAGASAALYLTGYALTSPSAGVAGNARAFHGNISGDLAGMMWGGSSNTQINFSRRVSMAFRFSQFPSSTASVTRVLLGKIHGAAVGDLTTAGIGVKYVPNGANFDFQLQVHNGTTLTSVTSSTQYAGGVADLEVVSDGAGNATLYLNGASVATTTGAPTGNTGANATVFAEVESTASTANQPIATIGRLYVNSLNF
jgi:hypothetical protein